MKTEKVAANAAKKAGSGAKRFAKSVGGFLGEVGDVIAAADAAASERRVRERKSAQEIAEATQTHIDRFGRAPMVEVHAIRECTSNTSFWDCEDPDCFWHKTEKQRRRIGTPTRNFRDSSN